MAGPRPSDRTAARVPCSPHDLAKDCPMSLSDLSPRVPTEAGVDSSRRLVVDRVTKTFTPGHRRPWSNAPRRRGRAVDDGSFEIQPGSVFGLICSKGSCKSTLTRILSSLVFTDAGPVRVFGYHIDRHSMAAREL